METAVINDRMMADAQNCAPAPRSASRLMPFRSVVLLYRAKGLSYEKIALRFQQQGVKVAPSTVVLFCNQHVRETDVLRERRRMEAGLPPSETDEVRPPASKPVTAVPGKRGPKIARDDF
jgi:hypothetical protein